MPSDLAQGTQLARGRHRLDAGRGRRESSGAVGGVTGIRRHWVLLFLPLKPRRILVPEPESLPEGLLLCALPRVEAWTSVQGGGTPRSSEGPP